MKRIGTFSFFLLSMAMSISAHEYWLEPESFFLEVGKPRPIRMYTGSGLKVEEERPFQASKTSLLKMFSSDGLFDLVGQARDEEAPILNFSSEKSGTYVLAMDRNWSYITLDAQEFADYLKEDGIEYILDEREKLGESSKDGKERYSRYLKTILNVGNKRDKTYATRAGLKLEIVPLENPYSKKIGDSLNFQILFGGKPLSGRTVLADNREGESISRQQVISDKNGNIAVNLDKKGVWMVRLVYMRRCTKNCEGADWESFWGSLTFGAK